MLPHHLRRGPITMINSKTQPDNILQFLVLQYQGTFTRLVIEHVIKWILATQKPAEQV